jgi:AcrR family transcriptional regulator
VQDRARRTRGALIAAGSRAFAEQGFERSSLNAILHDAGVTKGAFRFHFASKAHLAATILGMERSVWPELARRTRERPAGGAQNLIDFSLEAACRLLQDPVTWAGLQMRVLGAPAGAADRSPWTGIVRGFLDQAGREGALRPGLDPGEVAESWFEAFIGVYMVAAGGCGGHRDLTRRLSTMWRIFMPAIVEPGAAARLRYVPRSADCVLPPDVWDGWDGWDRSARIPEL